MKITQAEAEKLAPWLGWRVTSDKHGSFYETRIWGENWDWCADVGEEVELFEEYVLAILNELALRGYTTKLTGWLGAFQPVWDFSISCGGANILAEAKPSIISAVVTAVLTLIEFQEK